ncbi:MAG: ComF family protein [Isosphaeraceae bacterium]|nr:ComF family protein [Isosphaeraceae bacterium]
MFDARRVRHWLAECGRAVEALVFPWECVECGEPAEGAPFCVDCRRKLLDGQGLVCDRCALPVGPFTDRTGGCGRCRGNSLGFDQAIALGRYEGPVRNLCLRLKHERNAWLAPWVVDLLLEAHSALRPLPADACVTAVPLHWRRHWRRGYNQADALAAALARRLSLCGVRPLRRVVATPPLAPIGRTERAQIMRDAFRPRRGAEIVLRGRTVLLVDDILTTGATSGAAARALKRAGAARVIAVVIGRAEGKV